MKIQLLKAMVLMLSMFAFNSIYAKEVALSNAKIRGIALNAELTTAEIETTVGIDSVFIKVFMLNSTADPDDCDGESVLILNRSSRNFNEIYALLLSAKLNEKKLNFVVAGSAQTGCYITQVELNYL